MSLRYGNPTATSSRTICPRCPLCPTSIDGFWSCINLCTLSIKAPLSIEELHEYQFCIFIRVLYKKLLSCYFFGYRDSCFCAVLPFTYSSFCCWFQSCHTMIVMSTPQCCAHVLKQKSYSVVIIKVLCVIIDRVTKLKVCLYLYSTAVLSSSAVLQSTLVIDIIQKAWWLIRVLIAVLEVLRFIKEAMAPPSAET